MKIVPRLNKKIREKMASNYSSWDPLTQAKYLYDLGQQIGPKIQITEAYELAMTATMLENSDETKPKTHRRPIT